MLIALISGIGYASFISNKIYEDSSTHLREIYGEVQKEFASLTNTNWNMLMDWNEYLSYGLDDLGKDDLNRYFQSDKDRWGYSEVYFLNEQSDYVTLDRKYGHLDCGSQIRPLLQEKQNVVMDTVQGGENHLTIFAIPAQKNFYYGFPYTAVAVSYDNAALAKALNITAFSGKSHDAICLMEPDISCFPLQVIKFHPRIFYLIWIIIPVFPQERRILLRKILKQKKTGSSSIAPTASPIILSISQQDFRTG